MFNLSMKHIEKRSKNQKLIKESSKKRCDFSQTVVLIMIFESVFVIILFYMGTLNELNQYLLVFKQRTKSLKRLNSLIEPINFINDSLRVLAQWCESENITDGRFFSPKNISISDCIFSRTSEYSGFGGVIYVKDGSFSMNISNSMFYICLSTYGGAIYFVSSNSFLRMICSNRCSASLFDHFAYLVAPLMNQVQYLSLSYCSPSVSGYRSIFIYSGNQKVESTNSSMNHAINYGGIYISCPSSSTCSHCTFSNNRVSSMACIFFISNTGTISLSYSNIVYNHNPSSYGVVLVEGEGS